MFLNFFRFLTNVPFFFFHFLRLEMSLANGHSASATSSSAALPSSSSSASSSSAPKLIVPPINNSIAAELSSSPPAPSSPSNRPLLCVAKPRNPKSIVPVDKNDFSLYLQVRRECRRKERKD